MSTERDAKGGYVERKRFQQKEMSREGDFETKSLSMERDVERKGCQENEVQRGRDVSKEWDENETAREREREREREAKRERGAKREGQRERERGKERGAKSEGERERGKERGAKREGQRERSKDGGAKREGQREGGKERGAKREGQRERGKERGMRCQEKEMACDRDVSTEWGAKRNRCQEKEMSRDRNAKREGCQYKKIQEKQNETNAKTQRCQIAQLARKHGPEDSGWPLQWHTALQHFLPTLAVFWDSCIYSIISSACQVNIQFRIRSWGKPISSLPSTMCNSANELFFWSPTFGVPFRSISCGKQTWEKVTLHGCAKQNCICVARLRMTGAQDPKQRRVKNREDVAISKWRARQPHRKIWFEHVWTNVNMVNDNALGFQINSVGLMSKHDFWYIWKCTKRPPGPESCYRVCRCHVVVPFFFRCRLPNFANMCKNQVQNLAKRAWAGLALDIFRDKMHLTGTEKLGATFTGLVAAEREHQKSAQHVEETMKNLHSAVDWTTQTHTHTSFIIL